MTDYVVGDIQGCYKGLKRLLKKIDFSADDRLFAVGDLVARGENSLSVLQYCHDLGERFHTVLGNHDLHLLAIGSGLKSAKPSDRLSKILSYNKRDNLFNWLRTMPLALRYDDNTLISHAGLYPAWSFSDAIKYSRIVEKKLQSEDYPRFLSEMYGNTPQTWSASLSKQDRARFIVNAFTRMRYVDHTGRLDFASKMSPQSSPQTLRPWFKFYNPHLTNKRVIFGHWASLNGRTHTTGIIGLDTGYVWGNQMTALNLKTGKKVSVDA